MFPWLPNKKSTMDDGFQTAFSASRASPSPMPPSYARYVGMYMSREDLSIPVLRKVDYDNLQDVRPKNGHRHLALMFCRTQRLFWMFKNKNRNHRDVTEMESLLIHNILPMGNLSNYQLYLDTFFNKKIRQKGGEYGLISVKSGKVTFPYAETFLPELNKRANAHRIPPWQRDDFDDEVIKYGPENILVFITVDGEDDSAEAPDPGTSSKSKAKNSQPASGGQFHEGKRFHLVDPTYEPGDTVELTIHDPSEKIAVTLTNKTKDRTKQYPSIPTASEDTKHSAAWFSKMAAKFGHKPFKMKVNAAGRFELYAEPVSEPESAPAVSASVVQEEQERPSLKRKWEQSRPGSQSGGAATLDPADDSDVSMDHFETPMSGSIEDLGVEMSEPSDSNQILPDRDNLAPETSSSNALESNTTVTSGGEQEAGIDIVSSLLDLFTQKPAEGDFLMSGDVLTIAPGPEVPGAPSSVMIATSTSYRSYISEEAASGVLQIPCSVLMELIVQHNREPFTLTTAELNELRMAANR